MASTREVFDRLFAAYGPQHWWPGETPFEVIVGAMLTQNTAWTNVERAIANLKEAGVLDPRRLYDLEVNELAELIKPAGYFRLKAGRLRNFLRFLHERFEGSLDQMFATNTFDLREMLLEVSGIGPETADSILLYAGEKPVFVVDAYTARVFKRHGWIELEADYTGIQDHFQASLPTDVRQFNEFHALIVRVGKEHCKKSQPRCEDCPLRDLLPPSGIVEPWCD